MTKHTPGPWRVGEIAGTVVTDHPIDTSGKNTGHNEVDYYGGYLVTESIYRVEDRRLIAAAPDLYEALVKMHSLMDFEERIENGEPIIFEDASGINEAFEMALKAIRKAAGREME